MAWNTFGMTIPGLKIDDKDALYPVVNERDARAGAGIMFVIAVVAFVYAFIIRNFTVISAVVLLFTIEFILRLINPHIAPLYALGRFVVRKMRPEYSGAAQKRFAWALGLLMALTMMVLLFIFGIRGYANLAICSICLVLLWLESSFGICLGCKMYNVFINKGWIKKPEVMPACPGGVCPLPKQ